MAAKPDNNAYQGRIKLSGQQVIKAPAGKSETKSAGTKKSGDLRSK